MPRGIAKNPEEKLKKLRKSLMGNKRTLGYKHSQESRQKMSKSKKGHFVSEETKKKIAEAQSGEKNHNYGKHYSYEYKRKMSELLKGHRHSDETKKKISIARKGKASFIGRHHPNWKGGISFEPYSIDWTETLKRSVRERDKYICQLCNQYGNNVHHIDYDKQNCNPNNLITLCKKCNAKVNYNRNTWIKYFTK